MSITDELRKWFKDRLFMGNGYAELTAIADRIDAEHEKECRVQFACGAEHGIGASVEAWMIQDPDFIELPKDADGVTIRIGDSIEYNTGGRDMVRFLTINRDGWTVNERGWKGETMHHIQPDSWERIIEDAMEAYQFDDGSSEPSIGSLVERCKRLAGVEA